MQYAYSVISSICGVLLIITRGWVNVPSRVDRIYDGILNRYFDQNVQGYLIINWEIIVLGIMIIAQGLMVVAFYNMVEEKLTKTTE